ncbi:hypothetical protein DUGA6_56690 [Duganella sp. HH105]|nr:hypothetical protein DUGA6_56690 [Duganella sp. HH105]
MRPHRARTLCRIAICPRTDIGLRQQIASVVIREHFRVVPDLAQRQTVEVVVLELFNEAGLRPMLRALRDIADLIVQIALRQPRHLACGRGAVPQSSGVHIVVIPLYQTIAQLGLGHVLHCVLLGRLPQHQPRALDTRQIAVVVVALSVHLRRILVVAMRQRHHPAPCIVAQRGRILAVKQRLRRPLRPALFIVAMQTQVVRRALRARVRPRQLADAVCRRVVFPVAVQVVFKALHHPVQRIEFHLGVRRRWWRRQRRLGALHRIDLLPRQAQRVDRIVDLPQVRVDQPGLPAQCVVRDLDDIAVRVDGADQIAPGIVTEARRYRFLRRLRHQVFNERGQAQHILVLDPHLPLRIGHRDLQAVVLADGVDIAGDSRADWLAEGAHQHWTPQRIVFAVRRRHATAAVVRHILAQRQAGRVVRLVRRDRLPVETPGQRAHHAADIIHVGQLRHGDARSTVILLGDRYRHLRPLAIGGASF